MVWELQRRETPHPPGALEHGLICVFSPDGKRMVTASDDKTARVWELQRRTPHPPGHTDNVLCVFSPDGKRMVTASRDQTARVWELQRRAPHPPGPHRLGQLCVFSPDGKRIVTASWDKTARVWDAADGGFRTLAGHTAQVKFASSVRTASGSSRRHGTGRRGSGMPSGQKLPPSGHTDSVSSACSVRTANHVTASADGTTRLWGATTGHELCTLTSFDAGREWLAVTPEGYYQGSLAAEQYIRWRVEGEKGEWPRLVGPEQISPRHFTDLIYSAICLPREASRRH